MKTTKTTTRHILAGAALALSIPLAACGGGSTETDVISGSSAAASAPMSASHELGVIDVLVESFEAKRSVPVPMSAPDEVALIRELAEQHGPTPVAGWSGASHEYR